MEGKTALITGGARRLGKTLALTLAARGCRILLHYNTSAREARQTAREIERRGSSCLLLQKDLSHPRQAEDLMEELYSQNETIDILINSASIFPRSTFQDTDYEDVLFNMKVNALSPFILARSFSRQIKNRGHVLNFLDTRILDYDHQHLAYHLSKRSLFTLTRLMALELAPEIQVNGIAPGLILPPPGKDESYLKNLASSNPLNSYGSPEDIQKAVLFLLDSPFITGQVLYIDGGRHLKGQVYGS